MMTIYEKLREARNQLGFSQDYVAKSIGIGRSAVAQIELGNRKVSTDELAGFCDLYRLSADYLIGKSDESVTDNQSVFARGFEDLTEGDQQEILNLIAFKKAMARGNA